jgi:hypothetical protein
MLRLNLRKGESTWRFGSPQWGVVDGPDLTPYEAAGRLKGKRVLFLVCGFNVVDPTDAYCRIASHVEDMYDEVVFVWYPGSKWPLAFWLAMWRAPKAGRMLAELLGALDCTIDLEVHSLGCRVALEAILYGLRCRNLILAGAAVPNEALALNARFGWCVANTKRVLVAYSKHDEVLAKAGRLGLFNTPLGLSGPEPGRKMLPQVTVVDCSSSVHKHNAYKGDTSIFIPAWKKMVEITASQVGGFR